MADYLVKRSYGFMWHFCHNSSGICFCSMTNSHITEYEVLLPGGQSDFDVQIDDSDTAHLVCQDSGGNIIYIKNEDKVWKKFTLLKSKTASAYPKNFKIIRVGNWINIIYTVESGGKRLLSHHILENSDIPNAVDYAMGDFDCTRDEYGNIYILYTNSEGSAGWRKFLWSRKEWSDFTAVSKNGRLSKPYIFVDEKIHITASVEDNIIYISETEEKIIAEGGTQPIIIKDEDCMYIMWKSLKDGKVWACMSSDKGRTFQKPAEFMAGRFVPAKLFALSCTTFEKCASRHCYGYIKDNAISLYLLGDFLKISKTPPRPEMPEVKKDADIELTKLKIQLQHISDSMSKLEFRINMLEKAIEPKQKNEQEK